MEEDCEYLIGGRCESFILTGYQCAYSVGEICNWNDYYPNDSPCKFWIDGNCTAKDEDLVTEEEFEELQQKETNQVIE